MAEVSSAFGALAGRVRVMRKEVLAFRLAVRAAGEDGPASREGPLTGREEPLTRARRGEDGGGAVAAKGGDCETTRASKSVGRSSSEGGGGGGGATKKSPSGKRAKVEPMAAAVAPT